MAVLCSGAGSAGSSSPPPAHQGHWCFWCFYLETRWGRTWPDVTREAVFLSGPGAGCGQEEWGPILHGPLPQGGSRGLTRLSANFSVSVSLAASTTIFCVFTESPAKGGPSWSGAAPWRPGGMAGEPGTGRGTWEDSQPAGLLVAWDSPGWDRAWSPAKPIR